MNKLAIASMVAALGLSAIAAAQYNGNSQSGTISSGPWMMRHSTGDKTADRLWFIMDRTLNAAEKDTLRTMFRNMKSGELAIQAAIVNAIDNSAKGNPNYSMGNANDWMSSNGMSEVQVYEAMNNGLNWKDRSAVQAWMNDATVSQMMAVAKLVQRGGWANSMWTGA